MPRRRVRAGWMDGSGGGTEVIDRKDSFVFLETGPGGDVFSSPMEGQRWRVQILR